MLSLAVFEAELLQIKYLMDWQHFANHNANYCHKHRSELVAFLFSVHCLVFKSRE